MREESEWYRYTVQQQQTDDDSAARGMQTLCTFPVGLFRDQLLSLCSDRNTFRQDFGLQSIYERRLLGQLDNKSSNRKTVCFFTTRRER